MLWDQVVGYKCVGSGRQHASGVILHERVCLDMKVPEHFIRTPTADEADDVGVNLCQEEGCCASSP